MRNFVKLTSEEYEVMQAWKYNASQPNVLSGLIGVHMSVLGLPNKTKIGTRKNYYSEWKEFDKSLISQKFMEKLGDIVAYLREKDAGIFYDFDRVTEFCTQNMTHLKVNEGVYGFKIEEPEHSFLIEIIMDDINPVDYFLAKYVINICCFEKDKLTEYVRKAKQGIRFITSKYEDNFILKNGGKILVYPDGTKPVAHICWFVDETHMEINRKTYHIAEYAEICEKAGVKVAAFPSYVKDGGQ